MNIPLDPHAVYSAGASEPVQAGFDRKSILRWCLPRFYTCHEMGAQSVEVGVRLRLENPIDEGSTVDLSAAFGTILWGSGAASMEMDFDLVDGVSLSVPTDGMTVYVTYPGPRDATHPDLRIDVAVGIGTTRGPAASARRTVFLGDIPAGGGASPYVTIPRFASGAVLINTNIAVATATFEQLTAAGGQIVSAAPIGKPDASVVPVARGRGARFFRVLNPSALISNGTAVVFFLAPN